MVAATERQFTDEERDIEACQAEVDTAQALLDRKRKRAGFTRMVDGWRALDAEVVCGKSSRDAADEESDERQEPPDGEAAA